MKISNIIKDLQYYQGIYGNIDVMIKNSFGDNKKMSASFIKVMVDDKNHYEVEREKFKLLLDGSEHGA